LPYAIRRAAFEAWNVSAQFDVRMSRSAATPIHPARMKAWSRRYSCDATVTQSRWRRCSGAIP
jgi:hypothetical protein